MLSVCVCTREFMAQLKERGVDEGHIININRYEYEEKAMLSCLFHCLVANELTFLDNLLTHLLINNNIIAALIFFLTFMYFLS